VFICVLIYVCEREPELYRGLQRQPCIQTLTLEHSRTWQNWNTHHQLPVIYQPLSCLIANNGQNWKAEDSDRLNAPCNPFQAGKGPVSTGKKNANMLPDRFSIDMMVFQHMRLWFHYDVPNAANL